jgi:NADH dehydrogenase/NADH:ubiquinone oxidoreductase subunit G
LFIKNNNIIKVLPGYDKILYKTNWISDKSRFSFDGMFSPENIINSFLENNRKKSFASLSWQKLFKEFFCTLYFQNHLSNHFYQPHSTVICLGKTISLEVLNLLNILTHKYSFFNLRQSEPQNINADLEQSYLLDSNLSNEIQTSDTCLLVGLNPRYEGSKLNLKLRARYLKGNFKVIQLGSLVDLTFSIKNITSITHILKSLVEGNNLFCQEFINSSNPILISNEEIFKRKDAFGVTNMLTFLIKYFTLFSRYNDHSRFNVLHSSLNSVGFINFNGLKTIKSEDFKSAAGIYFINNSFSTSNIKKLLSLKLLNFFQDSTRNDKVLVTQNSSLDARLITQLKKGFNLQSHLHLPNSVLFETSGTYLNTEGNVNNVTKVVKPLGQTKND